MTGSPLGFARHLSIVWGVTLAVITIIEWNSLDRDPLRKDILSPFIERQITVSGTPVGAYDSDIPAGGLPRGGYPDDFPDSSSTSGLPDALTYEVEFDFNGPLFLAAFFLPVGLFNGIAWLLASLRKP